MDDGFNSERVSSKFIMPIHYLLYCNLDNKKEERITGCYLTPFLYGSSKFSELNKFEFVGIINSNLYEIDYCGLENLYENAKSFYTEGEFVVLRYSFIATDTDYSFTFDGESVDFSYRNGAFEICFKMPDHNVKLECHSVNTMTMNAHSEFTDGENQIAECKEEEYE